MLNHVQSWLYVDRLLRSVMVLGGLLGLYGLKYDSATACGLPLYLCSYKLVGSATPRVILLQSTLGGWLLVTSGTF